MARTNKYTSINFNHVLEKTNHSNSNSNSINSSSKTKPVTNNVFSARTEGRMLVLSRPTPKPKPVPQPVRNPQDHRQEPERPRSEPAPAVSDSISLRPQGRTGAGTGSGCFQPVLGLEKEKEGADVIWSPKSNKFVPPHLRPGFVSREERPGPEFVKGLRPVRIGGGEDERPKSGGGYDRRMRVVGGGGGGESELGLLGRLRSGENRPNSSGW